MRKSLLAAAALAPFCLAVSSKPAAAATPVTNSRNTPISTSTANNGQPDDVDIQSGGAVQVGTGGPAVVLDSNNSVQNEGAIKITDVDKAVGVQIQGGHTGNFNNTGSITVTESYAASDTVNSDSIVEAPFAKGSGRSGVLVSGASPFNGSLNNNAGGTITVQGNNSYGLSVEAPLVGSILNAGTISLPGTMAWLCAKPPA